MPILEEDKIWEDHNIKARVTKILEDVKDDGHHFQRPFLTAYQLAIKVNQAAPITGYSVGGKGTGTGTKKSLAQYLALQLSNRIKLRKLQGIEGAFISSENLKEISFDNYGEHIVACGFSMFRMKNQKDAV